MRWAWCWLALGLALGLLAPWLGPVLGLDPQAIDRGCMRGCGPGVRHWLGTDPRGRDLAAQLLFGARTALWGGLTATLLAGALGFGLGSGAAWSSRSGGRVPWWVLATAALGVAGVGYLLRYGEDPGPAAVALALATVAACGGLGRVSAAGAVGVRADRLLLFAVEVVSSIPALLLLLALAALALRPGLATFVGLYAGLLTARLSALSLQAVRQELGRPYVAAAHFAGVPGWRLLGAHVLPNVLPAYAVELVLVAAGFVLVEGTFSFLGLGLPPTTPSWGQALAATRGARGAWWLWAFPGLALVGTVLALQVVGRALRRRHAGTGAA